MHKFTKTYTVHLMDSMSFSVHHKDKASSTCLQDGLELISPITWQNKALTNPDYTTSDNTSHSKMPGSPGKQRACFRGQKR